MIVGFMYAPKIFSSVFVRKTLKVKHISQRYVACIFPIPRVGDLTKFADK